MNTREAFRRKLKSECGFTLAELLITILILLMVSSVVAAGVPAAANAYRKVMDAANAQMLLSTTVTSLRRELAFAQSVPVKGTAVENAFQYTNGENGHTTSLTKESTGIAKTWTDITGSSPQLLVSEVAATKGMVSSFGNISYSDGFFVISNLQIKKPGYNAPLASIEELRIRAVRKP